MAKLLLCCLLFPVFNPWAIAQRLTELEPANCAVLIPGSFIHSSDTIPTAVGDIVYHTWHSKDSTIQYLVSFCNYPEGTVHSDSTELLHEFFSTTISASVEKTRGNKRYESGMLQSGFPGRFWRIDIGDHHYIKTRAFVAGSRFYSLQVIGSTKTDQDKAEAAFFDSFRFIDLLKARK